MHQDHAAVVPGVELNGFSYNGKENLKTSNCYKRANTDTNSIAFVGAQVGKAQHVGLL